ncbi:IclR family transcriptional regulator domain-containing protein [Martelella alba]|uniref:IclR-ED domain-containing protein n=1 Tax=Martelella alba TaxID=2590451 RepID=A0ABY2SDW2_9HYPH|nr:IclR family transcriptional regulator C-terminal domain-containing protein [Martelella alba]TKI02823.1 hypothetical protein FCN80_23775 [Martelella alba]
MSALSSLVQLDRHIRLHDPLLQAASSLMCELSNTTGATVLLCRLHDWNVLCTHEEKGIKEPRHISYERGRAMSLFRGASSRAILASLDIPVVQQIRMRACNEIHQAGLPADEDALFSLLARWRQQRVVSACEEVDKGVMAWGVAIKSRSQLLGSLSLLLRNDRDAPPPASDLARRLSGTALRIEARLE